MKVTYKCIKIDSHTFSPQTYFQPNIQSLQEIVIRNDFFATKNMLLAMIKISRQHLIVDANSKFFANDTSIVGKIILIVTKNLVLSIHIVYSNKI